MDEIHYDETGRTKWSRAESGIITQWIYDKDRDLVVRCVEDVQTDGVCGVPVGWKTLPGMGQNIVTEYEYDDRGRTVCSTTTGISLPLCFFGQHSPEAGADVMIAHPE